MAQFGAYKMLIGEVVRCYHYNIYAKCYEFNRLAYYIGNGYSIGSFEKPIYPIKYDRYIPNRLYDSVKCKLLTTDWNLEDFNTENLIDFEYQGQFDEFDWWGQLQKELDIKLKNARLNVNFNRQ